MSADRPPLTRRTLLLGATSMAVLAACSDGTSQDDRREGASRPTSSDGSRFSLIAFFGGPVVQAGIRQRVTFGIGDAHGAIIDDGPERLDLEVMLDRKVVDRSVATRHRQGLSRGYYPLSFVPRRPGYHTVRTKVDGERVDATFEVSAKVPIPQVGQTMVAVDTPTSADHRGVNPICTRSPVCDLHRVSLRDALAAHSPVALLMATPAFCQTEICGPVLDVLLSQQREFSGRIQMIHAEVYADGRKAADDISRAALAPVLQAFHLPFEPVLFLSRADGTIAARLDTIFDEVELATALRSVVA